MDIHQLIREIENLPPDKQLEILIYLNSKLKKKEQLLKSIDEVRGIGKGLWDIDAQEYINQMRNDRL